MANYLPNNSKRYLFAISLCVIFQLKELVFLKSFWIAILYSIYRVISGFFIALLLGVVIGVISGMNQYILEFINPLVTAIKSTPVMSFIIIALVWFSSTNVPIFICILMCFPVIWTNVVEGIRNVDQKLLGMAKLYRVSNFTIFKKIYLPSIMPYFFAATLTSLGLGWKVTIAAEVLSHPRYSIGSNLYSAKVYLDSSEMFAWTLVIICLSLIFESLLTWFVVKINSEKQPAIKME